MGKSIGFEVHLNGEKVARAGIDKEKYVVNCIIDAVHRTDGSRELYLHVGGLDIETNTHVNWEGADLKKGDRIIIEVIDDNFDQPIHFSPGISKEERIEQQLRYFHELKEELKDYL